MLSEFEKQLIKQYEDRMFESGLNVNFGIEFSSKDIENYCIRNELLYQMTQKLQNSCEHSYSEPTYRYSQFGDSCVFTCGKCSHRLTLKI